ncbi:phage portal protein [Lactobacillus sp. CC-MHH1034]|nr:phage portal protein [Agrilactobacillus fermenti]
MADTVSVPGSITDNGLFIYPKDQDLGGVELKQFVNYYQNNLLNQYQNKMNLYLGKHNILTSKTHRNGSIDNRNVANLAHYVVDTYNGYFIGIPPKISLSDTVNNDKLQAWMNRNSFVDVLSEVSKQVDIYGRSFVFVYQNEDSKTHIAFSDPMHSFMIYDDTVQQEPLAFVRYIYDDSNKFSATVYFSDYGVQVDNDFNYGEKLPNVYGHVPAVEFFETQERQGVLDNIDTLQDALDKALSQKANQNEYFDNAYLAILGLRLPENTDGTPNFKLIENQVIYSPDADAANAKVEFLTKPDGDTMQEHLLDRLTNLIYQISMVPNLNDEAFSGNNSGVALQFKLLPMKNKAQNKERKFTQSLRNLYAVLFSTGTIIPESNKDAWEELKFKFTRNMPVNLADEADVVQKLDGQVSDETKLSALSLVDDPKSELDKIANEQSERTKRAIQDSASATDIQKSTASASALASDGDTTIQKVSLNGAQITSLVNIVQSVAAKTLPYDSALAMLTASFPFNEAQAKEMLGNAGKGFNLSKDDVNGI